MPCRDDYPDPDPRELVNTMVNAALCAVLTQLEQQHSSNDQNGLEYVLNNINYKEAGIKRKDLERWWNEHKRQDQARREREAYEAEQQRLKTSGLSKLTTEERRALGL